MKAVLSAVAITSSFVALNGNDDVVIQDWIKSKLLEQFTSLTGIGLTADRLSFNPGTFSINLSNASITYPPNFSISNDLSNIPGTPNTTDTFYNLSIETLSVKPSFLHFLMGNGWIRQVSGERIRGDLDKRFLKVSNDPLHTSKYIPKKNDFYLDQGVHFEDVSLNVYQAQQRDPVNVFIEKVECPLLRKRWLLYDFLSEETKLKGTFHFESPVSIQHGKFHASNMHLKHLKWNINSAESSFFASSIAHNLSQVASSSFHDPFSHLLHSKVDIQCSIKDGIDTNKEFNVDLHFKDNHFHPQLSLFSRPFPSFVKFLNETKPSFCIKSRFSISKDSFYCAWNLKDAGIHSQLMHHSFHYFNKFINNRSTQLELLAKYSYWSINNALSFTRPIYQEIKS